MSWKGFTKSIARLPTRLGRGESTHDTEFDDLNARFHELHKKTEKLHDDAKKFRNAVSGMLNHQADFALILEEIYNPVTGGAAAESGTIRRMKTPVQSMKTVQEFSSVMTDIRDTILPELELIDRRVVQPTSDFLTIIKLISKTITKRDHKRLDYDRHRNSLRSLKDKKEKTLSDEKKITKLEEQLEQATSDYEYHNDLLKKELPLFFQYRTQFIEPVFEELYYMQLKIYGLLLGNIDQLAASGYFDVQSDIIEGFDERREGIQQQLEELQVLGRRSKLENRGSNQDSRTPSQSGASGSKNRIDEDLSEDEEQPPPYSLRPTTTASSSASTTRSYSQNTNSKLFPAANKIPPPRPPPITKPKPNVKYVVALYDYEAQADGDLSFKKDDKIQVIERTDDVDDWWTGKLNGVTGVFPGNYVKEI